jgi:hypothetical protein
MQPVSETGYIDALAGLLPLPSSLLSRNSKNQAPRAEVWIYAEEFAGSRVVFVRACFYCASSGIGAGGHQQQQPILQHADHDKTFATPNGTLGNPSFGLSTSTQSPERQLQFGLGFVF